MEPDVPMGTAGRHASSTHTSYHLVLRTSIQLQLNRMTGMHVAYADLSMHIADQETDAGLRRTGVLFGGLRNDLKYAPTSFRIRCKRAHFRRKLPWYLSDYTDFFRGRITQSIAASIFLFFANVTKIITFGGVMEHMLHDQMVAGF